MIEDENKSVEEQIPNQSLYSPNKYEARSLSKLAVIALILSVIFPIVGLVVDIVALIKINNDEYKGKALAWVGLVIATLILLPLVPLIYIWLGLHFTTW